ncbi:MAG: hypothetical protein ACFE94_14505 [Candidatus Hodarchaeota archaeon]
MSEKGFNNSIVKKDDEKILYGIKKIVCFACGEQIEKDTEICPYCKTSIDNSFTQIS